MSQPLARASTQPFPDDRYGKTHIVGSHTEAASGLPRSSQEKSVDRALRVHIASDSPNLADRLYEALKRCRVACGPESVTSITTILESAEDVANDVDVVFVASSEDFGVYTAAIEKMAKTNATIVAVGLGGDSRRILEVIRAGADDYLEDGPDFDSELHTLVERLCKKISPANRIGRLYSVIGTSGGSGASLVALNLAAAIARREAACGLLDLQLQGGDLAAMLNATPRYTIADLFAMPNVPDRTVFEQSIAAIPGGIGLLAGPELFSDVRQANPQLIQSIVDIARSSFGHVIVDLEDVVHREQFWTVTSSDRVVVVFRLEFAPLIRTRQYIDHLLSAGVDREKLVVVANRCGGSSDVPRDKAVRALGTEIAQMLPEDPSHVLPAVNLGAPVVIDSPKSPFAKAVERLVDGIGVGTRAETVDSGSRRWAGGLAASLAMTKNWLDWNAG